MSEGWSEWDTWWVAIYIGGVVGATPSKHFKVALNVVFAGVRFNVAAHEANCGFAYTLGIVVQTSHDLLPKGSVGHVDGVGLHNAFQGLQGICSDLQ